MERKVPTSSRRRWRAHISQGYCQPQLSHSQGSGECCPGTTLLHTYTSHISRREVTSPKRHWAKRKFSNSFPQSRVFLTAFPTPRQTCAEGKFQSKAPHPYSLIFPLGKPLPALLDLKEKNKERGTTGKQRPVVQEQPRRGSWPPKGGPVSPHGLEAAVLSVFMKCFSSKVSVLRSEDSNKMQNLCCLPASCGGILEFFLRYNCSQINIFPMSSVFFFFQILLVLFFFNGV